MEPCQVGWHSSVIPALRRLRQEEGKFETSLGHIVRLCLKKNPGVAGHACTPGGRDQKDCSLMPARQNVSKTSSQSINR
jgi:hypothetical protein